MCWRLCYFEVVVKSGVVVLTTRQNFVWTSMQEIIPFIENAWTSLADEKSLKCETLNVDELPLKELLFKIMTCEKIVITAFNAKMAQVMMTIRTKFNIDTPFIFYIHGFSSLALWPLAEWGLTDLFTDKDCFISSSSRDVAQFKVSSDHKVFQVPFTVDTTMEEAILDEDKTMNRFYYVGRISEQKNLHSLIYSFYLAKKAQPQIPMFLDIFGEYDKLGSPNMGLSGDDYDRYLKDLIKKLNLGEMIKWHGFVKREKIIKSIEIGKKIFISASLHSDENFGMAVLRSLMKGHRVIVSDWGGLSDFVEHFPKQTTLVETEITNKGPVLCPENLSQLIISLCFKEEIDHEDELPKYYTMDSIREKLFAAFNYKGQNTESKFKSYAKELSLKRKELSKKLDEEKRKESCQIFTSYFDEMVALLLAPYATRAERKEYKKLEGKVDHKFRLPPWVDIDGNQIKINDPHRGNEEYLMTGALDLAVSHYNGESKLISNETFNKLWKNGYIFIGE